MEDSTSDPADAPLDSTQRAVRLLARRILRVPLKPVSGTLCRAVRAKYLRRTPPEPLHYRASASKGARYTPVGGPAGLYLARGQEVAFAEIGDLATGPDGRPLPLRPNEPVTLVYVETTVSRVLDLTDGAIRQRLGVSLKAILAEWEAPMLRYLAGTDEMPLTQQFGEAAHSTKVVAGILYPSARRKKGLCLVVFPDRLTGSDRVASYDPTGELAQVLVPGS